MMSVSKSQKSVATTQVQVSMGSSRNEASEAPAHKQEKHIYVKPTLIFHVNVIKDYS